jgi:type I restriction enzyme S subunit
MNYEVNKSSDNEWLGKIPGHWKVLKLKYAALVQSSNVDKKGNEGEKPVLLCNYIDVYKNDFIDGTIKFMEATASENEILKFKLLEDDVLITKDSETPDDIAIPAYVNKGIDNVLCGYHLALVRSNKDILKGAYLYYLFKSYRFNQQFTIAANGITRFGLSIDDIRNAFISIPPDSDQLQIATYLNNKTHQIDDLISKKQKLIDLLKEERTAVINQTVTKGLDSSVPMKDSGIEWFGEIPAHWDLITIKKICKINPPKSEIHLPELTEVVFLPMEKVSEDGNYNDSELKPLLTLKSGFTYFAKGDVILAKITPCFENGKGAFLESLKTPIGFGSTEFHVLRPIVGISDGIYLYYFTHSNCFTQVGEAFMVGSAGQKRVQTSFLENFFIPLPPYSEQLSIAERLRSMLMQIDYSIKSIQKEIELISEYKTSLINEAVTGKIDIRDYTINHA